MQVGGAATVNNDTTSDKYIPGALSLEILNTKYHILGGRFGNSSSWAPESCNLEYCLYCADWSSVPHY